MFVYTQDGVNQSVRGRALVNLNQHSSVFVERGPGADYVVVALQLPTKWALAKTKTEADAQAIVARIYRALAVGLGAVDLNEAEKLTNFTN